MASGEYSEVWEKSTPQGFWGEIAPCEHVVQIYEDDHVFMDLLGGFVAGGIHLGECVIVIATTSHLKQLDTFLKTEGFNTFDLSLTDQLIAINAERALEQFMVNGWPDEVLFNHFVTQLIARAHRKKRKVRAFGEMVALLWSQGLNGATVQLENLWNKFCRDEAFSLFCAYPKSGFTQDAHDSLLHICGAHSKIIAGFGHPKSEVMYKNVPRRLAG